MLNIKSLCHTIQTLLTRPNFLPRHTDMIKLDAPNSDTQKYNICVDRNTRKFRIPIILLLTSLLKAKHISEMEI